MITEFQKNQRQFYIGSSDAPSIVGVNPWRSAADIYWDKVQPKVEDDSNEAMEIGTLCESGVLSWFQKETGKKILRNQRRVHQKNKIMSASFDALVVDSVEAVEAKTTGILNPFNKGEWGEPGTDEVPEHIIVQCQHQMAVLPELKIVWVPVLMGGVGFRLYKIERNDDLISDLEKIEMDFWNDYVDKKIPPPDNLPTIDTIKRLRREPNKTVSIEDGLVLRWLEAKKKSSLADKEKDEAQRAVLAAIGDAEAGDCSLGRVTYFAQTSKEKIIPASSYRVARFKETKKEVV